MMDRIDVLRLLMEAREDGLEREERITLVDHERSEAEYHSVWDEEEQDIPDSRYDD
tara:strand:- start:380 stop:547 length:168 start_codon:yes stop_codon:yes gene_type:complete